MLLGYNFGKEKNFKIILDFIVVIWSKSHIMEVSHTTLQTKPSVQVLAIILLVTVPIPFFTFINDNVPKLSIQKPYTVNIPTTTILHKI